MTLKEISLPLIRTMMPNLIANEICGVQPISAPSGLIFSIRPKYGLPKGSAQKTSSYDNWLKENHIVDNRANIDIYINDLLN